MNAETFTKGTALTYACENGHTAVAEVLIHHGAELVSCCSCSCFLVTCTLISSVSNMACQNSYIK